MKLVKIRQKKKHFGILKVKISALCAILVLCMLFSVSCIEEPSDWLSPLLGELSLSVKVTSKGEKNAITASLMIAVPPYENEAARRAYTLKYISPDSLNGMNERFDGKTLTLSFDGFEDAAFEYNCGVENAAPLSLGARAVALFTPSTVKEVKRGGTYTEIITDNAIYYVDESGIVREISSADIRVVIEEYLT